MAMKTRKRQPTTTAPLIPSVANAVPAPPAWEAGHQITAAQQGVGLLVGRSDDQWQIRSGAALLKARRAASCLLQPAVGDTVSFCLVAPEEAWITAILQREDAPEHVISADRPLRVEAPELTLRSERMHLQADDTELVADRLHLVSQELNVFGATLKMVGQVLSSVFDRVTHHAQHHLRHTEAVDRVQAGHVELQAKQTVRLSSEHTLIDGHQLVKARGGQIHFG